MSLNLAMLVSSFKYFVTFESLVSLARWIHTLVTDASYSDDKFIRAFKKQDYDVAESISHLIKDISRLDSLTIHFDNIGNIRTVILLLLNAGVNSYQVTLQLAAEYGFEDLVRTALQNGADPCDESMINARNAGYTEIAKILIGHGSNIYVKIKLPLAMSAYRGHSEIVKLLLESGADIHGSEDEALYYALNQGHTEVVSLLLNYGVNIDEYMLRIACELCYTEIIKLLLDHGAKPHTIALRKSIFNNHIEAVQMLLEAGADVNELKSTYRIDIDNMSEEMIKLIKLS